MPTPEKYCEYCGKKLERRPLSNGYEEPLYWFNKRKYCSIVCANRANHAKDISLPVKNAKTSRRRARDMMPFAPCAICGKIGYTEVHHKDKNPMNNSLENLVRLCKSCHAKQHRERRLCVVCGMPAKGHGLCAKHWQAWRKSIKRGWDTEYTAQIKKVMAKMNNGEMPEPVGQPDETDL